MKLILASDLSCLLNKGYNLTGIQKEKMKIGWVTTASKVSRDQTFIEKVRKTITDNNYKFEEIDIEGKTKEELKAFFEDKNVIHVEGGNTFYLLKAIKESGFADILKELLSEGKVYIGTSAGSYIMCPTIEVANWNDSGRDRFGMTDFTALNYVPFVLKVHYKDDKDTLIKEKINILKYPLRILRDGQGILVEDDKYTFFGIGDEVKITQTSFRIC
ncbi:MAG: Type 1 glutamine amidotransferase-like domain-containing protein [Candidatus Paceibacterota bacterium]|jgi:dipeptidase E